MTVRGFREWHENNGKVIITYRLFFESNCKKRPDTFKAFGLSTREDERLLIC